jgi:hypothetical protein
VKIIGYKRNDEMNCIDCKYCQNTQFWTISKSNKNPNAGVLARYELLLSLGFNVFICIFIPKKIYSTIDISKYVCVCYLFVCLCEKLINFEFINNFSILCSKFLYRKTLKAFRFMELVKNPASWQQF